jgi:phage terminase large subunit
MLTIDTARVFEPLFQSSRYKGAWGGRGSGKSHYMAGALVEYCLLNPSSRIVCIREVQKTLAQSAKLLNSESSTTASRPQAEERCSRSIPARRETGQRHRGESQLAG